jgi:hypothetical protein
MKGLRKTGRGRKQLRPAHILLCLLLTTVFASLFAVLVVGDGTSSSQNLRRRRRTGLSQTVAVSVRDDDFCDDVSDADEETTTSACSYWTVKQRTFLCKRGSTKSLFASRIADGVCDCCDGSDEAETGLAECPDVCAPET